MNCPHCGKTISLAHIKRAATQSLFCPDCGTLLRLAAPQTEERHPAPLAQTQIVAPPPVMSPGPLLTGQVTFDAVLGFLQEIVAAALLIYAVVVFSASQPWEMFYRGLLALGAVATAMLLLWHADTMRKRYPHFASGWQRGRKIWGKGADYLVTLLFGGAMLAILFPLGGLLICLGMAYGPVAWVGALLVAYLFGILARRMSGGGKGHNKP